MRMVRSGAYSAVCGERGEFIRRPCVLEQRNPFRTTQKPIQQLSLRDNGVTLVSSASPHGLQRLMMRTYYFFNGKAENVRIRPFAPCKDTLPGSTVETVVAKGPWLSKHALPSPLTPAPARSPPARCLRPHALPDRSQPPEGQNVPLDVNPFKCLFKGYPKVTKHICQDLGVTCLFPAR